MVLDLIMVDKIDINYYNYANYSLITRPDRVS